MNTLRTNLKLDEDKKNNNKKDEDDKNSNPPVSYRIKDDKKEDEYDEGEIMPKAQGEPYT